MKWVGLAVILVLLAPSVFAAEGSVKLLALVESETSSTGTLADLQLETQPGEGRVFLDTFPLTKIATQISLRFAEQIACAELDVDCSRTDFFYTIRAAPGIVGGPSAGAAAAVLTTALVDGRKLDPSVGITGTINSGGFIGPVGGLQQKIEAAADAGLKKVLIPQGTSTIRDERNQSIDLIAYGDELGVEVVEVATLDEAMVHFTGSPIRKEQVPFTIEAEYSTKMKEVAKNLCGRYERDEQVTNLTSAADAYFAGGEYYSAASYCFRANIDLREAQLQGIGREEFRQLVSDVAREATRLNDAADEQEIKTMTDVQTYMLVKERIAETQQSLAPLAVTRNIDASAIRDLAYAQERLYSAETWATFFGNGGQEYEVDEFTLEQSCYSKIGEAEERFNYVQSLFPQTLKGTRQTLDRAIQEAKQDDFILCLHDAAKAKSEADSLISVTGAEQSQLEEIIDVKLDATKRGLARAQSKGTFPLIGYAYYEYARALKDEDPYSSLLFAEYASELSNLDIYFTKHKRLFFDLRPLRDIALAFLVGAVAGGWFIASRRLKRRKK